MNTDSPRTSNFQVASVQDMQYYSTYTWRKSTAPASWLLLAGCRAACRPAPAVFSGSRESYTYGPSWARLDQFLLAMPLPIAITRTWISPAPAAVSVRAPANSSNAPATITFRLTAPSKAGTSMSLPCSIPGVLARHCTTWRCGGGIPRILV